MGMYIFNIQMYMTLYGEHISVVLNNSREDYFRKRVILWGLLVVCCRHKLIDGNQIKWFNILDQIHFVILVCIQCCQLFQWIIECHLWECLFYRRPILLLFQLMVFCRVLCKIFFLIRVKPRINWRLLIRSWVVLEAQL